MSVNSTSALPSLTLDLVVGASWLYYHLGFTQAEVAESLGISRTSVANLLAEAREKGIIQIRLEPSYLRSIQAAEELREIFGLADAYVAPAPKGSTTGELTRNLGKAGALYVEANLRAGDILAVGWGLTIVEMAGALSGAKDIEDLTVAQLVGVFSTTDMYNPGSIVSRFAERLRARLFHLYLPAFVSSPQVRELLLEDPAIHSALEIVKSANKAVVGIGKVAEEATIVKAGLISPIQMDELRAKGAVGDIATKYYDIQGGPVTTALDDRFTGLSLEDLGRIPSIIAVAGGADKTEAILGALRSKRVAVLITDEHTARNVLAMERAGTSSRSLP